MQVFFRKKDFNDDCESIITLLYLEKNGRAQKYIADFFHLDLDYINKVDREEGNNYIRNALLNEVKKSEGIINTKIAVVEKKWGEISDEIFSVLNEIFEYPFAEEKDIHAEFSINAMCPYDYDALSFDINYRKNKDEIILGCVHEIIHFYWFTKWALVFLDADNEEESKKHLAWLFSEIAVDAILKETLLSKYCVIDKPAYKYFYDIQIDGQNMMEYFRELFVQENMDGFMRKGIEFIYKNRQFIPD